MEERKSIQIHEDFFSYGKPKNRTVKNRPSANEVKIKQPRANNSTLKATKQSLARMLRDHQEKKYQEQKHNQTSNFGNMSGTYAVANKLLENITQDNPPVYDNGQVEPKQPVHMHSNVPNMTAVPKFGCLKNGTLPTYRMVHNAPAPPYQPPISSTTVLPVYNNVPMTAPVYNTTPIMPEIVQVDNTRQQEESNALKEMNSSINSKQLKPGKYKKTYKRKYKVGKPKGGKHVGVLVANKKVRTNITLKMQTLKQEPLAAIRKFLVKDGFITVGSQTPEHVLRQIYESIKLVCGNLNNTNADTLVYNHFHNDDSQD